MANFEKSQLVNSGSYKELVKFLVEFFKVTPAVAFKHHLSSRFQFNIIKLLAFNRCYDIRDKGVSLNTPESPFTI